MPQALPVCKNSTCPSFRSNREIIVIRETSQDVVFGCKTCLGVQVRTLDWRRAEQANYERLTNPEYARIRKHFFLGRNSRAT